MIQEMLDGGDLGSHTVVPLIYCGASETQLPYPTARHVCTLLKSCSQLVILQLDLWALYAGTVYHHGRAD